MKKLSLILAAVFTAGVFAAAQEFPPAPQADRQKAREEWAKKIEAAREKEAALHKEYTAAQTDKQKKEVEEKINKQAAKDFDEQNEMVKKGIDGAQKRLDEAKERQSKMEADRDNVIAKRTEAVKKGDFAKKKGPGKGRPEADKDRKDKKETGAPKK